MPLGRWLEAQREARRWPFTTTGDSGGRGHVLRTFNTRPDLYPTDTRSE